MKHKFIVNIIILLVFLTGFSACGGISEPSAGLDLPDKSPTRTVSGYLEALKSKDFGKAYEFISPGYAGNLDKESYEINMKHSLVENYNWSLINYEILGVRILGDQAYVVAELEVKLQPLNSDRQVHKKIQNQYILGVVRDNWKIAADNCISNCVTAEDFGEQARY